MTVIPMASLRDLSKLLLLKTLPFHGSKTHINRFLSTQSYFIIILKIWRLISSGTVKKNQSLSYDYQNIYKTYSVNIFGRILQNKYIQIINILTLMEIFMIIYLFIINMLCDSVCLCVWEAPVYPENLIWNW